MVRWRSVSRGSSLEWRAPVLLLQSPHDLTVTRHRLRDTDTANTDTFVAGDGMGGGRGYGLDTGLVVDHQEFEAWKARADTDKQVADAARAVAAAAKKQSVASASPASIKKIRRVKNRGCFHSVEDLQAWLARDAREHVFASTRLPDMGDN